MIQRQLQRRIVLTCCSRTGAAIGNGSVQKASDYLLNITDEEVWFWTSKLLDDSVGVSKVISALCIISGTWENMQPRGQICIHLVQKDWLQLKIDS